MKEGHNHSDSDVIGNIPLACSDELAAVEFFEKQRWGKFPACVHCGSVGVYKMVDPKTGERSARFLWRCRDCSRAVHGSHRHSLRRVPHPLRHWCYAFWRACTSKKGVSALGD